MAHVDWLIRGPKAAASTGRLAVPGIMAMTIEPIRNPVAGVPHRAIIRPPEGLE